MPKKIRPEEDEWFGVEDAKKRKQIQDRLAQRARRLRLAKSSNKRISSSSSEDIPSDNPSRELVSVKSQKNRSSVKSSYGFHSRGLSTPSSEPKLSQDHSHLTLPIFTVYSALYHNGIILGIPCATSGISKSRLPSPHVPVPLHPIQMQLDQVHYSFIDRVPQKFLRHNMIAHSDEFSIEDLTADLFTMPSFIIEPGCPSWDPTGWSVAPEFRKKWGILFDSKFPTPKSVESLDPQDSQ